MYLDFHTHSVINHDSIFNVVLTEESMAGYEEWMDMKAVSLGIHPWYIDENIVEKTYDFLRENGRAGNVKYIGEVGLDKLKGADLAVQEKVFLSQVRIAEALKKPLVIHCVRAFNEVIAIQKLLKPKVPLVIHGFSKKAELAKELIAKGFFLSFGADILNKPHVQEAFVSTSLERIFLETDDREDITIHQIYQKAAELKGLEVEEVKEIVYQNYINVIRNF